MPKGFPNYEKQQFWETISQILPVVTIFLLKSLGMWVPNISVSSKHIFVLGSPTYVPFFAFSVFSSRVKNLKHQEKQLGWFEKPTKSHFKGGKWQILTIIVGFNEVGS